MSKEPTKLSKGKAFHKQIQDSWHKEAEGDVETEKGIIKQSGKRGRIDIIVDAGNETKGLVEIKNSNWDAMTDKAVKRNIRRQIKQVWDYIESQPNNADGVCPGILFPNKPKDEIRMKLIEEMFEAEGIPVVWEDETIKERKARGDQGE